MAHWHMTGTMEGINDVTQAQEYYGQGLGISTKGGQTTPSRKKSVGKKRVRPRGIIHAFPEQKRAALQSKEALEERVVPPGAADEPLPENSEGQTPDASSTEPEVPPVPAALAFMAKIPGINQLAPPWNYIALGAGAILAARLVRNIL